MSKENDVLEALKEQLKGYFSDPVKWGGGRVDVFRNIAVPAEIPPGGCIIIRDGDPGQPDQCLGQSPVCFYSHRVEIEAYVENGNDQERDNAHALLTSGVGAGIDADPTLGGETKGCVYGRPGSKITPIDGGADIKSALIIATFDYQTNSPLA